MACSIIRTGEVTTVFDEGGNVSTLFQEAMDEFNEVEQALDVFYTSRSQEFSENSGVFYRDATLNDVLRFYTNYGVSSSSVHVFSPKETIEVIDAMKNMGIKSVYELNEVMQDLFHNADGVFEIDAEKLVKSGYYTMEEVLALESSDIIHTLNRLSKFVLTGFDVVVSDAEYSGYKNTTVQKNMFGAYPFISSLEVKQYIAENGLDSLEGTPYSFVLDNSLEGVSGKQRVKTKRKVKDITREDTVERLSKTSLANRVHILSSEGIRGVLDRIGFSEELKNQVISYRGIRKALDVLNTKTNHRDYGELMNGIYFGELPVALAFAGYNVFSPGLEEHSQLFKAKIDDSKFVTIDMKGHTPGSDENFIKIVGEERYLKLLEQKRSGEITGMKLINAPEFLHGEEKQVQYVVFDRELIELTASFRGKALQDLGAMTLRLSTEGVQLTPNGFVYKGDVYLNNDVYETETAVHEFSHLYLDRLKEVNPFLYERGIELIKTEGFEYINHVRRTQPNLVGERLYEEALAQAVGEEGAKIIDEGKRNKFLSFIRDLWESIKSSLSLSGMTYDQASKLNLKEYSRAIAIDLLSGEPLNNFGNKADSLNLNSVEFSFLEQSELDSQGNIRPEVARAIREERIRIENEARGNETLTVGEVTQQLQKTMLAEKVHTLSPQQIEQELIRRGVDSNVAKQVAYNEEGVEINLDGKKLNLYHSTANMLIGDFRIRNISGFYGVYFASSKRDSKVFGDRTYKVSIKPKNTLIIQDNEVKKYNFFNISKESYEKYIEDGFDSIAWYQKGKIKEFVVLDTKIIGDRHLQFQKAGLGLLPNGFVDLKTREVFLNQETANLDTPIHEFSHLFTDILKQTNSQLYQRGLELIEKEGKEYIDFVKKNQPNLKGEALLDEALNQAVGEAGERIINKQSKFFQWLQDMWNSIKDMVGLTQYSWNEVKDMSLQQFTEAMAVDLLRGEELNIETNKTLQGAEEQEQLKRLNLEKLNEISEEYEQGNRIFKRLPQREQSGFTRIGRTGIETAIHLDAVFGANENGAANKAEQERALKEYAKRSNVWVEDIVQQRGEPHTEGQEALVWFNEDTNIVTKSILPLEQTPQEFLDRVSIHNSIFPETQIKVIGFTETKSGELQYIVEQPLVVFERGATQAEVSEMMSKLGFEHTGENDYANNETLIEDLHPGNALIDINTGRVVVIDPIIRLNTKEAGYGGERVVGTNNVSELEKSLAEEEVRQQEVEQENIFKRDVLNILVKNNLISNDTFLQLSSLESFNVENVSSILRNNEEAFEGMSDRSIGKKLMSITPVNFEHIFNKWGESFSNEYVEDYVDSLIRNNVVEMRDEDNNICASHGLFFNGVKFGGKWKVVKDLKGKPSHKRGGVDIQLTEKGVKVAKGGTDIIAEKGLVFRYN